MVQVSNLYKSKIYSTERTINAKVSFEILDPKAYEDASVGVTDEAEISRLTQSFNKVRDMSNKYATFEPDYWQLDGSFVLPPRESEGDAELGWWSDELCGADGIFAERPVMTFAFTDTHSSIGLTVTFDRQANEYAKQFRIEAYGQDGTLLVSQLIGGNTSPVYYFNQPLDGYTKVVITIIEWIHPYRRARITEVDFGSVQEYTGDKLIDLSIVEEMDLLASTVPSNQMTFTLDNSDQYFNILNPDGVYRYIVPNQEMRATFGLLIGESKFEWIDMGKYYLNEWKVEEGSMTSTFTGHDIFTILDMIDYTPPTLTGQITLYDLAVDVFTQAKIDDYSIDETLKAISVDGFTEVLKVRQALQYIAIAGMCIVRQGRNGEIILEHYEELTYETGYVTWTGSLSTGTGEFAGPETYAQVYVDYTYQQISFDNAYEIPQIVLGSQVKQLTFPVKNADDTTTDLVFLNSLVKDGIGYSISNPLITTEEHASQVAEWMFTYYNLIADYQASWRQNPALECGNVILLEDRFGNKKKARITKNDFKFSGYLEGTTEAKGGV
jgi:hypothetical protein